MIKTKFGNDNIDEVYYKIVSSKEDTKRKLFKKRSIKMREVKKGKGVFKTTGSYFKKDKNPETRCWQCQIYYACTKKLLGVYEDPFAAETVYNLIKEEVDAVE